MSLSTKLRMMFGKILCCKVSTSTSLSFPRELRGKTLSTPNKDKLNDHRMDRHRPVMKEEVIEFLDPKDDQVYLDMTFGAGGHTNAILNCSSSITVFALDRDPVAINIAESQTSYRDRLNPMLGRFSELEVVAKEAGLHAGTIDGVIIDAGCSSMQFDTAERGFALSQDGPLDMRMDGDRNPNQPTAADIVNSLNVETLTKIISGYGEEKQARKIAQLIVEFREKYHPIKTTAELSNIVSFAFTHSQSDRSKDMLGRRMHVATRTFQALRIFVNNELEELSIGVNFAGKCLKPGGKLAVLTFHSLEDRIVKRIMQGRDVMEPGRSIHQKKQASFEKDWEEDEVKLDKIWAFEDKMIKPSEGEIEMNPRSRSAKLRKAIKL